MAQAEAVSDPWTSKEEQLRYPDRQLKAYSERARVPWASPQAESLPSRCYCSTETSSRSALLAAVDVATEN